MSYARADGRNAEEMRPISVVFVGLDGVDGSGRFGFSETKALASVSGPIEVRLAAEQASQATFEVFVRPLAGLPGTEAKALASTLRSALIPSMILNNNPRTLIQLVAQSLTPVQSNATSDRRTSLLRVGPSSVAAAINAASLALLNASSFPLRGVVCAAGVGRLRSSSDLLLDPSEEETAALNGGGTFAFLIFGSKQESTRAPDLVWSNWNAAPFREDELVRATALAQAGAQKVWEHIKDAVAHETFGTPFTSDQARKKEKPIASEELSDAKMEIL